MPHKTGLNRKEQIQCALWLTEGIDPKLIAKKFRTSVDVVKRFTQEKLDEAADKANARAKKMNLITQKRREKAAVVNEALDQGKDADADFV